MRLADKAKPHNIIGNTTNVQNLIHFLILSDLLVGDGAGQPGGGRPREVHRLVHQGEAQADGRGVEDQAGHRDSETLDYIHDGVLRQRVESLSQTPMCDPATPRVLNF